MKLHNVRIGKRLIGAFSIFTCIILLSCAISLVALNDSADKANQIVNVNFQKAATANLILINIQAITSNTGVAVNNKDKNLLGVNTERRNEYKAAMEKLEKIETDQAGKDLIAKLKGQTAAGRAASAKMVKAFDESNFEEASRVYSGELVPVTNQNIDVVKEIIAYQEKAIKAKYDEIAGEN